MNKIDNPVAKPRRMLPIKKPKIIELIEIGVFVKNPDIGLVDFYSKFGDEDIFLCYKYPEKTISFWHGVGEGFTRRKNIESLKKTSSR